MFDFRLFVKARPLTLFNFTKWKALHVKFTINLSLRILQALRTLLLFLFNNLGLCETKE